MSIPVSETTITVLRKPGDPAEAYSTVLSHVAIATGIRAVITPPGGAQGGGTGQERLSGSEQSIARFRLNCDTTDIRYTDRVRDERTGVMYDVVWSMQRTGFGLDHTTAALKLVEGVA